jgi:hypothetical protein
VPGRCDSSSAWKHPEVTAPAHEPGLIRADPPGASEGPTLPVRVDQQALFADGTWDLVTVVRRCADRSGGWRVLLRWHEGDSVREGWFFLRTSSDQQKLRDLPSQ